MSESVSAEISPRSVPYVVVVGRGNTARFRFMREHLEQPGSVEVIWDRRVRDRRLAVEPGVLDRRSQDRRQPLPISWTALNFVMAPRRGVAPRR